MAANIKINLSNASASNKTDLLFSINGIEKRIRITTGVQCLPVDWDNQGQKIKRSDKNYGDKNRLLFQRKEELDKVILRLQAKGAKIDKEAVKGLLTWIWKNSISNETYEQLKKAFLGEKKRNVKEITLAKKYIPVFNVLEAFSKFTGIKINIHTFSDKEFTAFQDYCYNDRGNTNNGFDKTLSVLKTFFKWCNNKGYTNNDFLTTIKRSSTHPEIHPLSNNELSVLENAEGVFTGLKEDVRNIFLFQCYTGLRFSDVFRVTNSHIQNGIIRIVTEKTQKPVKIPLLKRTKKIINRYQTTGGKSIFPKINNQVFNRYLKVLFADLQLNREVEITTCIRRNITRETKRLCDVISSHDGRRSFITLTLTGGMNAWQLMTITGHEKFETFKKYVHFTDEEINTRFIEVWKDE